MRRTKAGGRRTSARKRAYLAGRKAARKYPFSEGSENAISRLNRLWYEYRKFRPSKVSSWRSYFLTAKSFARGFGNAIGGKSPDWVPVPTNKRIAAVVTVMNEAGTLRKLVKQLARLPVEETIIVVNGSSDDSFTVARESGAIVVHDPDPLGHDVGRAIGARMVKSDIVLFLDGDIPVKAELMVPFLYAVHSGSDIALNNIKPFLGPLRKWDNVTVMKEFLNRCLNRSDLSANSLTAVPHAMSEKALTTIGAQALMVPPKAQAIAIRRGLKVTAPFSVNVISLNRSRIHNVGASNPVSKLIVGDHLEALQTVRMERGPRMGFLDTIRKREVVEEKKGMRNTWT